MNIRLLFCLLCSFTSLCSVIAINEGWTPPVGIPYPHTMNGTAMGITNSCMIYANPAFTYDYADDGATGPVPYRKTTNGVPYTHYIHPQHPKASNSNNPNGTESRPRETWPLNLGPGTVVYIRGTNTAQNSGPGNKLTLSGRGTDTNGVWRPIYFVGFDRPSSTNLHANTTWIDRKEVIVAGTNILIENIAFSKVQISTRNNFGQSPSYNLVARNCYVVGGGTIADPSSAFSFSGYSPALYSGNTMIFRCEIHNYGDRFAPKENDRTGAISGNFQTNSWMLENLVYHMSADATRLGSDAGKERLNKNYFVGRNMFYENRENGIDVKQADSAVISENLMFGFRPSSSSGGTALALHYNPRNIWIINNVISNSTQGIVSSEVQTGDENAVFVIGNLVVNCDENGMYLTRGRGTFYVVNDTVHGCLNNFYTAGTVDGIHYRNNISSGILDPRKGRHLGMSTATAAGSTAKNFLFWQQDGGLRLTHGSSSHNNLPGWMRDARMGTGSKTANPLYVNPAAGNFTLRESSPAIDAGVSTADIFARFKAAWGFELRPQDILGTPLPTGAERDLGAFEFRAARR
jgi:hypothetical protein